MPTLPAWCSTHAAFLTTLSISHSMIVTATERSTMSMCFTPAMARTKEPSHGAYGPMRGMSDIPLRILSWSMVCLWGITHVRTNLPIRADRWRASALCAMNSATCSGFRTFTPLPTPDLSLRGAIRLWIRARTTTTGVRRPFIRHMSVMRSNGRSRSMSRRARR